MVVARAQVGQHIRCCAMRGKLACGGMPPRKILGFRTSEIASAGFSGQVHVSVNNTHVQYSGSALIAIQPLSTFDRMLTLSRAALI